MSETDQDECQTAAWGNATPFEAGMKAWFRHRSGLRPSQQPSGEEEKHAQQNRVQKRGTKHTEKLAQIKSKQIYSCEVSLDTIRLKTFLHLSTLMNQKIQDNDNNPPPPPNPEARGAPR